MFSNEAERSVRRRFATCVLVIAGLFPPATRAQDIAPSPIVEGTAEGEEGLISTSALESAASEQSNAIHHAPMDAATKAYWARRFATASARSAPSDNAKASKLPLCAELRAAIADFNFEAEDVGAIVLEVQAKAVEVQSPRTQWCHGVFSGDNEPVSWDAMIGRDGHYQGTCEAAPNCVADRYYLAQVDPTDKRTVIAILDVDSLVTGQCE